MWSPERHRGLVVSSAFTGQILDREGETTQTYTPVSHGVHSLGHRRSPALVGLRRTAGYPDIMMLMTIANGTMPVARRLRRLGFLITHSGWYTGTEVTSAATSLSEAISSGSWDEEINTFMWKDERAIWLGR